MKICIVMPTYNESENIGAMIDTLQKVFNNASTGDEYLLLVVDGNSPDGTAHIVNQKATVYPNVFLQLEEKKAGLGAAYLYGFRKALERFSPDVIIEMDADFQHDPNVLPALVQKIHEGYDYVIGSRFAKGGSIPKDWAFYRKMLSIGGSMFSKVVLGIYSINDFTSGFKASRVRGFVDQLDLETALSGGFAYKLDLLYRMHKLGAKMAEVPINFGLRDRGDSKMAGNTFIDSLRVVLILRLGSKANFVKFCIVGGMGFVVDWGGFNILHFILNIASGHSALMSGFLAMLTTFTLNNIWSFKHNKITSLQKKLYSFAFYILSSTIPIVFRAKLVTIVTGYFGSAFLPTNIAFLGGIMIGLLWNFTIYSKVIWRDTDQDA